MKMTGDAVVLSGSGEDLSILLVKRKNEPYKNGWAFPGGFLNAGEDPLAGTRRELLEETGLVIDDDLVFPLTVRDKYRRDPRGTVRTFPFLFLMKEEKNVSGMDDALDAKWVRVSAIDELAFDHGAILAEAIGLFFPFISSRKGVPSIDLPKMFSCGKNLGQDFNHQVTIFGGSFSPPHMGHSSCLTLCPSSNLLIVADSNPWKENKGECCYWKSLKLICNFFENVAPIYPGFFGRESPNYTVDLVSTINSTTRELILGDDTFADLFKWKDPDRLLKIVDKIWVVPRDGDAGQRLELIKKINSGYSVEIEVLKNHQYENLSSTLIRK